VLECGRDLKALARYFRGGTAVEQFVGRERNQRACLRHLVRNVVVARPRQLRRYVASHEMKRIASVILASVLLATPGVAQNLAYLRNWVGKYPVSTPGEPRQNIYRTRLLQRRLIKLLGWKNYNRLLKDYHVMGPVKMAGDYVLVDRCERHNCDESASFMAVNFRKGDVHVAFYKLHNLEWFHSKGTARDLPREVLDTEWWQIYGPLIKSTSEVTRRAT
jgi:hypothetical protein